MDVERKTRILKLAATNISPFQTPGMDYRTGIPGEQRDVANSSRNFTTANMPAMSSPQIASLKQQAAPTMQAQQQALPITKLPSFGQAFRQTFAN